LIASVMDGPTGIYFPLVLRPSARTRSKNNMLDAYSEYPALQTGFRV
jgi:hypothetical protein